MKKKVDALVVGSGIAGAAAALALREAGKSVLVVRKGYGATALSSGAFDLAWDPRRSPARPLRSRTAHIEILRDLCETRPGCAFAKAEPWGGLEGLPARVGEAVEFLNRRLPGGPLIEWDAFEGKWATAFTGLLRPASGGLAGLALPLEAIEGKKLLVVGVVGLAHLRPEDAARLLEPLAAEVATAEVGVPGPGGVSRSPAKVAERLDNPAAAKHMAAEVAARAGEAELVLLPPVLGLENNAEVRSIFEKELGRPFVETLGFSPSAPGLRLQKALDAALAAAGAEILQGEARGFAGQEGRLVSAEVAAPGGAVTVEFGAAVLASGRLISGGLKKKGGLAEPLLGLPLFLDGRPVEEFPQDELYAMQVLGPHPIERAGLETDGAFRPLGHRGAPVYSNLHACGSLLAGLSLIQDGAGLAPALLGGMLAGRAAAAS